MCFGLEGTFISNPPQKWEKKSSWVPDDIHGPCPHFGITAHDWHTGSKRPVDAEHHKLCAAGNNCKVAVCKSVVASGEWKEPQRLRKSRQTKIKLSFFFFP